MDNETPKYATWIPEAGGYVANGNVVSKSPIYDEAGKLKLDVDTSVFGNTTPLKTQPQVANQAQSNVGVTTANIQGSGTDANAAVTNIGDMASLADNKQNGLDSVLSSPAMRSPSAGEPILTIEQQDLKEIQDAKARNDLQGMINGYIKLGRDTNADYSATISDLTKQRQKKIESTDDQYLQEIDNVRQQVNSAKSQGDITGDYTKYNQALAEYTQLLSEQEKWRNDVGYAQSMADMYQAEQESIDLDYVSSYMKGINDITNQIIQMFPSILNFEYNPNTDTALYIAQGYAQSRVKETMNATGMYYSTMTQSAISRAVAELVPVYEKMAREEMIENFKLLQSTASFLMDLEQTQFNLWRSQVELKWEENQEKRRQINQAIENMNARGYATNEEAAILGIAPGTESPDARKRAQDKQDQIEAEERNLIQNEKLADYKANIEKKRMQEEERLKEKYYQFQLDHPINNSGYQPISITPNTDGSLDIELPANRTDWGTYDVDKLISYYNDLKKAGETDATIFAKLWEEAKSRGAYEQAIARIKNGDTNPKAEAKSLSEMQKLLNDMVGTATPSQILDRAYELAEENGVSNIGDLLNAVSYAKDNEDSELKGKMFDASMLNSMGKEAYKLYLDYYVQNDGDAIDMLDNIDTFITSLNNGYDTKTISGEEYDGVLENLNRNLISTQYLDKTLRSNNLGTDDAKKTKEIVDRARNVIDGYAESLYNSNAPLKEDYIADVYSRLVDKIGNTSDKFDYNWMPGNTGKASKTEAIRNIIYSVRDNPTYGKSIAPSIYSTVLGTANILAGQGKIDEIDASYKRNPEKTPLIL